VSWHQKGYSNLFLNFNEARYDGMAVASAGPYANHLHLAPDRQPHQHVITQYLTGRMLFLMPNQQCQSNEGMYCSNNDLEFSLHSFIPTPLFILQAVHNPIVSICF